MLRLTSLAASTALAVCCSLIAAGPAAAEEQGWWYSHPRGYSNSSSWSSSTPGYYYVPPLSTYALVSPKVGASTGSRSYYYTPSESISDSTARISVHVPANAEVWFDGNPTQQRGERRTYVSPSLDSDRNLHYSVRARWIDTNERTVEQTRRVVVRGGQLSMVDFVRPESAEMKPKSAETTPLSSSR